MTQAALATGDVPAVLMERSDRIATITLNAPDRRNPLSSATISDLRGKIAEIGINEDIHVAVLRSTGPVFCSGHDLKEMQSHRGDNDNGKAFFDQLFGHCAEMMQSITANPVPFIAHVDGVATAAGCQLVSVCDLAYASTGSRFCAPGVNFGHFCHTPMVGISRNISRKHAMEIALLGEMMEAEDAMRFGLVNRILPDAEALEAEVARVADRIASNSRTGTSAGKQAYYNHMEMGLKEAYSYASEVMVDTLLSQVSTEGYMAFLEKRKASWRQED